MRTRIKYCGIRSVTDAVAAAGAGADAIGLVQVPSARRFVPTDTAKKIIAALPPMISTVLLFADTDPDTVRATAVSLGVKTVQLVGDESPEQVAAIGSGIRVIKSIRVSPGNFLADVQDWLDARDELDLQNLTALLAESPASAGTGGGTGVENLWDEVATALDELAEANMPLIAAGGLNPTNVGKVVSRIRPLAVDVSTGIEKTFGSKDPALMEQFMNAVRKADLD